MNAMTPSAPLMTCSRQWAERPADQRFLSLPAMLDYKARLREASKSYVIDTKKIEVQPFGDDHKGLVIATPDGALGPSHWAFGQACQLASTPADYMRRIPSELVADNMNYGLASRALAEVGVYMSFEDENNPLLRAMTGPNYGRVFDYDVIDALIKRFGDGVTSDFRVPGEFGRAVQVTKQNTTLYASDQDMFVFLADERNRIEVGGRMLARGFFIWNSEVGDGTLGVAVFLYDYVCCNRIVWGPQGYEEIRIRHTKSAPDKFFSEVSPALLSYANSETTSIVDAVNKAQAAKIEEDVETFFKNRRFSTITAKAIMNAHVADEGKPIETLWDAATGITAYARNVEQQNLRVDLERRAGELLSLAA